MEGGELIETTAFPSLYPLVDGYMVCGDMWCVWVNSLSHIHPWQWHGVVLLVRRVREKFGWGRG